MIAIFALFIIVIIFKFFFVVVLNAAFCLYEITEMCIMHSNIQLKRNEAPSFSPFSFDIINPNSRHKQRAIDDKEINTTVFSSLIAKRPYVVWIRVSSTVRMMSTLLSD